MFIMKNGPNQQTDTKQRNSNVLQYLSKHTIRLELPFILTEKKILTLGGLYIKIENWLADSKTEPIRLLEVWLDDNIVYLKVQNIINLKISTLDWNLDSSIDYWLWSIADIDFLFKLKEKPIV